MAGGRDVALQSRWKAKNLTEHLLPYAPLVPVTEGRDSGNMHWKIWERGNIARNKLMRMVMQIFVLLR